MKFLTSKSKVQTFV